MLEDLMMKLTHLKFGIRREVELPQEDSLLVLSLDEDLFGR
jgi:hypothetical protein